MGEYNYDEQVIPLPPSLPSFRDCHLRSSVITDPQGQFFPFFVIALLLLVLLPTTYSSLFKRKSCFPINAIDLTGI